jgi:hypothetical protein
MKLRLDISNWHRNLSLDGPHSERGASNQDQRRDNYRPGIGTGHANCRTINIGDIRISGGSITALVTGSDDYGAGISGGYPVYGNSLFGSITITGGTVTANGLYGAGIGTGYALYGWVLELGNITISGGTDMRPGASPPGFGPGRRTRMRHRHSTASRFAATQSSRPRGPAARGSVLGARLAGYPD